jgi:hypothetical protein
LPGIRDVLSTRPSSQVKEHLRTQTHPSNRYLTGGFRLNDLLVRVVVAQKPPTTTCGHEYGVVLRIAGERLERADDVERVS